MKTLEELKIFFEKELSEDLNVLEAKRKRIVPVRNAAGIVLICLSAIAIYLLYRWDPEQIGLFGGALVVLVPGFFIWLGIRKLISKSYVLQYKNTIFPKLAHFIDENFHYSMSECIPESQYRDSKIILAGEYRKKKPRLLSRSVSYQGKNLFFGSIDNVKLRFSEVEERHGSAQGYLTPFEGLFFVVSFNKEFAGNTVIISKREQEHFFGSVGKLLQPWSKTRDPVMEIGSPDFKKSFAVHSNNMFFTNSLLDEILVKIILDIQNNINYCSYILSLSFIGTNLSVAVNEYRDFEPRYSYKANDTESIQRWFGLLEFVVHTAKMAEGNKRIWKT